MLVEFLVMYRGGYGSFDVGQVADVPELFAESLIDRHEATQAGTKSEPPALNPVPTPIVPPRTVKAIRPSEGK